SRLASLYGLVTRISSRTPGSTSRFLGSIAPVLPVMPMAVRVGPGIGWGVRPISRIVAKARSTCSGVAWLCMTTSIAGLGGASLRRDGRCVPVQPTVWGHKAGDQKGTGTSVEVPVPSKRGDPRPRLQAVQFDPLDHAGGGRDRGQAAAGRADAHGIHRQA